MIRQYPDPRSGTDLARWPFGVNVMDDITIMPQSYAQKMDNIEYKKGTPWRRRPFVAKSTEQFDDVATEAIEYIDSTGTSHILFGSYDGKIKEWQTVSSHSDVVTGLTANKLSNFAQMLGACFHQNGDDRPRRGDVSTWREAGAPSVAGTVSFGAASAGAVTGSFIWMVTACVKVGSDVILESDHSNYIDASLSSEQQIINWVASADTRVNWYRIYRTQDGQGTPFFLLSEGNILTYTDNTTDEDLSEQLANPLGRNCRMPVSKLITQAGDRLVCAGLVDLDDPNAARGVHVSIVATNQYEMENFPDDQIHKFYLPGPGDVTAAIGYSVKDEDYAAKDLFLAQRTACFILRGTDPFGVLEPVSYTKGVISKKAVIQWGRYLFFVSRDGLEFLGPQGDPVLVSPHVSAYFLGGGSLGLLPSTGDEYVTLEIHQGRLLITMRDQAGLVWGNKALVMDLDRFDPFNPKVGETAYFTVWYLVGGGMSHFLALRDGGLLLFDNMNRRLLQRHTTGGKDLVNGASVKIRCTIWTSGMMSEFMSVLKVVRQINVLQLSEDDTTVDLIFDRGINTVTGKTIPRFVNPISWDRDWDRTWTEGAIFLSSLFLPRRGKGRFVQARIHIENNSAEYVFIGMTVFYSAVKARRMVTR